MSSVLVMSRLLATAAEKMIKVGGKLCVCVGVLVCVGMKDWKSGMVE